jgi:hypothetical protein
LHDYLRLYIGVSLKAAITTSLILGTLASGFSKAGRIATFDAPGAGQGTFPININDCGDIIGFFIDCQSSGHAE